MYPYELQDWLASLHPPIDVEIVATLPTKGEVLMEGGEANFISKMQQAGASQQQAEERGRRCLICGVRAGPEDTG